MATPVASFDLSGQIFSMGRQTHLTPAPAEPVFICIDCEAFESDQSKVTEIGVAALDTRDIEDVGPGVNGERWLAKMKYAHFRPVEYAMNVNRRFVHGAEDQFAFGETIWINLKDAAEVVTRIFHCPRLLSQAADFSKALPEERRNIVFVAHGVSNDDEYLSRLGFKLKQASNVARQVDTQRIAGGTKKNQIGLKRLLEKLGMQHQGLHNGGNDAAYTLQALIVMAVKEVQQPGRIFQPGVFPRITLPGVVRAAGQSAPHVYGGTAREGEVPLPVAGGKSGKTKPFKRLFKKGKTARPDATSAGAPVPVPLASSRKRSAPVDEDDADEQPPRKKHGK